MSIELIGSIWGHFYEYYRGENVNENHGEMRFSSQSGPLGAPTNDIKYTEAVGAVEYPFCGTKKSIANRGHQSGRFLPLLHPHICPCEVFMGTPQFRTFGLIFPTLDAQVVFSTKLKNITACL